MTRDYKPSAHSHTPQEKGSPFATGLIVGLVLGIALSLGVAVYVKNGASPFQQNPAAPGASPAVSPPAENAPPKPEAPVPPEEKAALTFHDILTGHEVAQTKPAPNPPAAEEQARNAAGEIHFLQVGAFQTEQEADNLKARLAMLGMEAVVQTTSAAGKPTLHRVQVGPLQQDEINSKRAELKRNGFDTTLVKARQ